VPAFLRPLFGSETELKAAVIFATRTWIISMVAFWIACELDLDSPQWTMLTVWIVAQPTSGMLLSKSLYRVFGTLAGCVLGLLLIVFFAQTPELFIGALALLMGVCTLAANALTNFRAYAAVLTGYTAAIVSLDAIAQPESIFYVAMARGSCIILAIVCSIVATSLFAPHRSGERAFANLKQALTEAARRASFPWDGNHAERLQLGRTLIDHLIALDTLMEFAAAESGLFRLHRPAATSLLAHLFGVISAKRSLDAHVIRCGMPIHPPLRKARDDIFNFLRAMPEKIDQEAIPDLIRQIDLLRTRLVILDPESLALAPEELVSQRVTIDRLDDVLHAFSGAMEDWIDIHGGPQERPHLALNFHRDQRAAVINALRAVLTVGGLGAFWIASAWTAGPAALTLAAVICSLFSSVPHPDRVGWAFFQSGCVAAVAAFFCKFFLLNHVFDYVMVAPVLGLFLIPAGVLIFYPRLAIYGAAFPIVFLSQIVPANPVTFDIVDFLNSGIATLSGVLAGTLAYVVIFPPDPRAARNYVIYRIRSGLEAIARLEPPPSIWAWTTRLYDRILRLSDPENLSGTHTNEWLETGLASVNLGCEIFRLRELLTDPGLSPDLRAPLEHLQAGFEEFLHHPEKAAAHAREALAQMPASPPPGGVNVRLLWARVRGTVEEIDACFDQPWSLVHRKPLPA
jgi:uncharacterized membrane protein YccC